VARLGRVIRCFKREGVQQAVMAGKIHKAVIYTPWRWLSLLPDWRMIRFWFRRRRRDNRDDSILLGLIAEFAADGIVFDSALNLCPELLVAEGILTRRQPTPAEERDIVFGWGLARK